MDTLTDSIADRLLKGQIVQFPRCPYPMPDEADLEFLRRYSPGKAKRKNISYHPETRSVHGLGIGAPEAGRVKRILTEHSARTERFLTETAPELTRGWKVATCSFRPEQEQGRNLSSHASNELLHVDAGAYGATHGDRILRFFVNINPKESRVWISKGTFTEIFNRYGREAGVTKENFPRGLRQSKAAAALSGGLRALSKAGVPLDRVLDGSPYDRAMRRLHNYMKDNAEFQNSPEGLQRFEFPPFSAWTVFTDMVSHACTSGQFALVSTFVVPKENGRLADLAPYRTLERALER